MPTRSSWATRGEPARRLTLCSVLLAVAGVPSLAQADPPPTELDQLTAPQPREGRRGRVPPPRLPDRLAVFGQVDPSAQELGLTRQEDGGYLYLDPGRRFTARFEPDGRVHFGDRWRRPDPRKPERGACCGRPPEGVLAGLNPFKGAPVQGPAEWISRSLGRDPTVSAKAKLLEETREFRTRLAVAFALELISTRLAALDGELKAIWNAVDRTPEDKRRLLFARWDECAERFDIETDDLPEQAIVRIDEARYEAAALARSQIEAFVRRHAPPGSRHAYSERELQRLNEHRISLTSFAPYASQDTP